MGRFVSVVGLVALAACGEPEPITPATPPAPAPPATKPAPPPVPVAAAPAPTTPSPHPVTTVDRLLKVGTKGTPDTAFGKNGVAPLSIRPTLVSTDGKGGLYIFDQRSMGANDTRVVAVHLGTSGAPDTSFGTNGELVLSPPGTSLVQGVTLDSKGRVVLLVSQKPAAASQAAVIAYRFADGKLDSSFNGGGAATITIPTPAVASRTGPVAIGADGAGRVVIAGADDPNAHRQIFVVRLTENGSVDPSFARGVAVNSHQNQVFDVAAVAVDPDHGNVTVVANKQVAGGVITSGSETVRAGGAIALFRFDSNGMVDTKFGTQGVATYEGTSCAALDATAGGGVLVGGYDGNSAATMKPTLMRWNDNGTLDAGFGSSGKVTIGIPASTLGRVTRVTKDGTRRIVAVGSYRSQQDTPVTFVMRFDGNGKPDATFGANGIVSFNVQSAAPEIDPQGSVFFRAP